MASLVLAITASLPSAAARNLTLRVSNETAPPGGWVQVKVYATPPSSIGSGTIAMDFDPSVFGGITNISVFSATGDALGFAHVNGNHVDAQFSSTSGGIGQVQGLPAFVVSLPVLSGLSAGQKTAVAVSMANVQLNDVYGNAYSTSAVAGTFQVGGGMAVAM